MEPTALKSLSADQSAGRAGRGLDTVVETDIVCESIAAVVFDGRRDRRASKRGATIWQYFFRILGCCCQRRVGCAVVGLHKTVHKVFNRQRRAYITLFVPAAHRKSNRIELVGDAPPKKFSEVLFRPTTHDLLAPTIQPGTLPCVVHVSHPQAMALAAYRNLWRSANVAFHGTSCSPAFREQTAKLFPRRHRKSQGI